MGKAIKMPNIANVKNAIDEYTHVLLGDLLQGYVNSSDSNFYSYGSSDVKTVTMRSAITIPYSGVTFHVICPANIHIKIYYGNSNNASWTTTEAAKYSSDWLTNNNSFTFPLNGVTIPDSNIWYYRIQFAYTDGKTSLDVDTVNSLISNGDLSIYYKDPTGGVIKRNPKAIEALAASATYYENTTSPTEKYRNVNFIHITDLHGNAYVLDNALKLATHIGSTAVLLTGDIVTQSSVDGYGYALAISKNYNIPVLVCTGNHDGVGQELTEFNDDFITPFATQYNYIHDAGLGYYYKDFSSAKIRIIALDCSDTTDHYRISALSSAQLSWFKTILNSTPSGYGVIVLEHQRFGYLTSDSISKYPQFVDYVGDTTPTSVTGASTILSDIDSFISNGGEFIMHASGHNHNDCTGILDGTEKTQLISNMACGALNFDMQNTFSPRFDGHGNGTDCMNVYSINRYTGKVRIIRVGSNTTDRLDTRWCQEIPYK
jgi:hypothetical protein